MMKKFKRKKFNPNKPYYLHEQKELSGKTAINYIFNHYVDVGDYDKNLDKFMHCAESNNWTVKYINSSHSDVFYFGTNTSITFQSGKFNKKSVTIHPGRYAIKFNNDLESELNKCSIVLNKFSKLGLIPYIYFYSQKFMIMDFIEGVKWYEFNNQLDNNLRSKKISRDEYINVKNTINEKKFNLLQVLKKFAGFYSLDLNSGNFVVTSNLKIYYIDPCKRPSSL